MSFVHEWLCRRRRRCSGRDRETEPDVPAVWPVLVGELPVGFQVEISLQVPNGKEVADLRPEADDARLKTADAVSGAAVTADLLIEVANNTDQKLLRQELRCLPVEMKVDAILVICGRIFQIVGKARGSRKFVPHRLVQVGVTGANVRGPMPNAHIREARRFVGADRNVAEPINHEVMHTLVPFQIYLRVEITKARHATVNI